MKVIFRLGLGSDSPNTFGVRGCTSRPSRLKNLYDPLPTRKLGTGSFCPQVRRTDSE